MTSQQRIREQLAGVPTRDVDRTYLTPGEQRALIGYAHIGHRRRTAAKLGISFHTLNTQLDMAFQVLRVSNVTGAYRRLGWLHAPDDLLP